MIADSMPRLTPSFKLLETAEALADDNDNLLKVAKRSLVEQALWVCGGCQKLAAARLRIPIANMNRYCQQYGIRPKDKDTYEIRT